MVKGDIVLITFPFTDLNGLNFDQQLFWQKQTLMLQLASSRHKFNGKSRQTFYYYLIRPTDLKNKLLSEQAKLQLLTEV